MIKFAVYRPVSVLMIGLAIIVLGTIAVKRIPLTFMPEIKSQNFVVKVNLRGASAEEIEKQITTPLERSISTVPGLLKYNSYSLKDSMSINLYFKNDIVLTETISILKERLESVALPEGSTRPKVSRVLANQDAVLRIAIKVKNTLKKNFDISQEISNTLIKDIEKNKGVAIASLIGGDDRYLKIELQSELLRAYNIAPNTIPDLIQQENKFQNVGEIFFEGSETPIRIGDEINSIEKLSNVVIKRDFTKQVKLGDISKISYEDKKTGYLVKFENSEALLVEVKKEAEANTVTVSNLVKETLNKFFSENDETYEYSILSDQGEDVQRAVDNVADSVRDGALLAGFIIFLLIQSSWPTFVIIVAIPLSLLVTFVLMYFTGVSFNIMSLSGLALGVGMLVDNSTVVLESISLESLTYKNIKEASLVGTKKVAAAIAGSTLATMAVFGPLAFVPGVIGQIFRDVAATVCYSIFASLLIALIFIPMLCAHQNLLKKIKLNDSKKKINTNIIFSTEFFQPNKKNIIKFLILYINIFLKKQLATYYKILEIIKTVLNFAFAPLKKILRIIIQFLFKVTNKNFELLQVFIKKSIEYFFNHPLKGAFIVFGSFVFGTALLMSLGSELFPEDPSDQIVYSLDFKPGSTRETILKQMAHLEKILKQEPIVKNVISVIGIEPGFVSKVYLQLNKIPKDNEMRLISQLFEKIPDMTFDREKLVIVSSSKPVRVEIFNEDLTELNIQTQKILAQLKKIPDLIDFESSNKQSIKEISIQFSKAQLGLLGLDPQQFINPIRSLLKGQEAGSTTIDGQSLNLKIESDQRFLDSFDQIKYFKINTDEDKSIYLSQVAQVEERSLSGSVAHDGKNRYTYIQANITTSDPEKINKRVEKILKDNKENGKINWKMSGQDAERKESTFNLMIAISLSLLVIYLMLASQFESLLLPVVVLCAVPLCISGMGLFLFIFNLNVSTLVFVGFIILVGSSVNTSIVMVDFANQLIETGLNPKDAILKATQKRMKPILVTTLSNLFGLIPMTLTAGEKGSALQQPLAVTILGGHISSTILTLIAVPLVYVYFMDKREKSV